MIGSFRNISRLLFPLLVIIILNVVSPGSAKAVNEDHHQRRTVFSTLGAGSGHAIWRDGKIPMFVEVTKTENKEKVSGVLAEAAAHLAARTCVQFYEVSAPTSTPYVTVKDTKEGSCSAGYSYSSSNPGSGILNYDGCYHKPLTVVHEYLHILGIGHEQKRVDSYDDLELNIDNIDPDGLSQLSAKYNDAYGEYDFSSIMHYDNWGKSNGNGPTYDAVRTGHRVGCRQMSDGDIAAVEFVTQNCWKEPMVPRCRVSSPNGMIVGRKFDKNVSFTALYKSEHLTPTFSNMPQGATAHDVTRSFGSTWVVELKPTATDLGKNFTITASYTTSDGKSTACKVEVQIESADYVCNRIPSTHANTCSGHGSCVSHDFPQCRCDAGYKGPFCEGVSRCPQDVVYNMEKDQAGRCLIPEDDPEINRVEGPAGEGYAANGTSVYLRTVLGIARQPVEASALVRFIGGEDGAHSVRFGVSTTYLSNRKVDGVFMDDSSWHELRTAFDWERRTYTEFIDGHWSNDGTMTSSECPDLNDPECAVDYVSAKASGTNASIMIDRVRFGCSSLHVTATTSEPLTGRSRLYGRVSLMFLTSHPAYTWSSSTGALEDLCTATNAKLLDGATYHVDPKNGQRMNVTLSQASSISLQPQGTEYITCIPQSKHLSDSSLPLDVAWGRKTFAVNGLCHTKRETIVYENVDIKEWSHYPRMPERVEWLNVTVPLLPNSDWYFKLYNGTTNTVMRVQLTVESKRLRLNNNSNIVTIYDDRFAALTEAELTMKIDWSTLDSIGQPTLSVTLLDVVLTQEFKAGTISRSLLYYWSNSPKKTVTFTYGCPDVENAPRPPMWPGELPPAPTTPVPPTTTPLSTTEPPQSTTDTVGGGVQTPTADGSVNATDDVTTATTNIISESPLTTTDGTTTTTAPSSGAPTTPSITPSQTDTPSRHAYQLRLLGTSWATVLDTKLSELRAALRNDLSRALNISSSQVGIESLSIGSLVVDFMLTASSGGAAQEEEEQLSDKDRVAAATAGNETFSETKALYVSSGGEASETIAMSTLEAVGNIQTQAPNSPTVTEPPSSAPTPGGEAEFSCGRGCQILLVIVAAIVVIALGGVSICLCGRGRKERGAAAAHAKGTDPYCNDEGGYPPTQVA